MDEPAADLGGFPAWLTTPFALFFEMLMILIFPMEIHELRKDGELVGISTTCAAGQVYFQPNPVWKSTVS